MGLDMYLEERRWIANYAHDPEGQKLAAAVLDALGIAPEDQAQYQNGGITVALPAMYWRKANAIHQWFVVNVQDGKDDCKEYYVSREKLAELQALCEGIANKTIDPSEMPTQDGFFFGSTEVDEWYFEDAKETAERLKAILAQDNKRVDFYYRSSW